jgi:cupin 2 domain-containing protein
MNGDNGNIFELVPEEIPSELFEDIATGRNVRIERIISQGHSSPESGWHDQCDNEWVIVLKGSARIEFKDRDPVHLTCGSYLNILSHTRHRVTWTAPNTETIWLAIHYK